MSRQAICWSLALVAALATEPGRPAPSRFVALPDSSFAVPDSIDTELSYVTDMAVDSDGDVFVADVRLSHVLQLDAAGRVRRIIGRFGGGPGEFSSALFLGFYHDSLWVYDPGEVRISLFPRRGPGVATMPLDGYRSPAPQVRGAPRAHSGAPMAILPDGNLLLGENVTMSDNPADGYRSTLLLRADRSLLILDTLATLANVHSSCVFVWRDGESHINEPFADDPMYPVSSDGLRYATISRTAPTGGGEQSFRVTLVDTRTRNRVIREISYYPRPLPKQVVDSAIAALASGMLGNLSSPVTVDSLRRRLFRPAYYPPVDRAKLARDGTLWLRVRFADGPDDAAEWLVLSPRGFELRRITAPNDFLMFEADHDMVWGVKLRSDDTQELARLRVARR